ncbi:hypothetical protein EMMF5_001222 [Cystobasidiomycetes sp. EMM_F5]
MSSSVNSTRASTPNTADSNGSKDDELEQRELLSSSVRLDGRRATDSVAARLPAKDSNNGNASVYLWFLTSMISISGLLFGLDTGIISGILVNIGTGLGHTLTNGDKELIASITTGGALIGGIAAGITSDKIGRRSLLMLADVTFIAGAVIQAVAHNMATMTAGRAILGLGVGMASCVCPLLISEMAPTHLRGRLVTVNVVAITFGQVVAYAIGAAFEKSSGGWRWMSGLCAIPAGVQIIALYFLPDSPRQLVLRNKLVTAKAALHKIYPSEDTTGLDCKISDLQRESHDQGVIFESHPLKRRMRDIVHIGSNRRSLIVACGLQFLQQLSGFNTLMTFSPTLFASMGFDNPTAVGLIVSGTNLLGTLVALKYIDIIGRRRILCFTVPGMVIGLLIASVAFHFLTINTGGKLDPTANYPASWSGLVLFAMVFYVASYSTGIGNVPWQQGELFTIAYTELNRSVLQRGIGTSLATGANWSSNLVISSTYLSLIDAITPTGAFALYGGICLLGFLFVYFCYPETAGLGLEEVQTIFQRGFGIRASAAMRATRKETEMANV